LNKKHASPSFMISGFTKVYFLTKTWPEKKALACNQYNSLHLSYVRGLVLAKYF